jgi:hypothetical protein
VWTLTSQPQAFSSDARRSTTASSRTETSIGVTVSSSSSSSDHSARKGRVAGQDPLYAHVALLGLGRSSVKNRLLERFDDELGGTYFVHQGPLREKQ